MGDILHELLRRDEQEEHGRSSRFHKVISLGVLVLSAIAYLFGKMFKTAYY